MDNHRDLVLYYHPLASFCHKVLVALYENETPFEARIVDLADQASSARDVVVLAGGKDPGAARRSVGSRPCRRPASSSSTWPSTTRARFRCCRPIREQALQARLWDRFFDLYVNAPMQKIVTDRLRPPGSGDPAGVEEAKATLARAYALLEPHMQARGPGRPATPSAWRTARRRRRCSTRTSWCRFRARIPTLAAYFERLLERPSVARTIDEARPVLPDVPRCAIGSPPGSRGCRPA